MTRSDRSQQKALIVSGTVAFIVTLFLLMFSQATSQHKALQEATAKCEQSGGVYVKFHREWKCLNKELFIDGE